MQAPKMYRTQEPEKAINEMAKRHTHVIVNNARVCEKRIPLRPDLLDMFVWRHSGWTAVGRHHFEQWQEDGGVLIDYTQKIGMQRMAQKAFGKFMRCGGYFFMECPGSMTYIESWALYATTEIVVHQPPNWRNHEQSITDRATTPEKVIALHDAMAARLEMPRTEREKAAAAVLKMGDKPYMVMTTEELSEMTGTSTIAAWRTFQSLRRHMTGFQYDALYPITLRVKPDEPAMRMLYEHIETFPTVGKGERMLKAWMMSKATRKWQGILKRLCVEGYAEKKKNLHAIVMRPDRRPLVHSIGKRSRTAQTELREMIRYVEALPDYLTHCRQFPASALPEHCEGEVPGSDTAC